MFLYTVNASETAADKLLKELYVLLIANLIQYRESRENLSAFLL